MENSWEEMIDDESVDKEELFFKLRDMYMALLKHLYNDPKDIPEFRLYFCLEKRTLSEGSRRGYPVMMLMHRTNKTETFTVRDVSEIENFENSYTWYQNNLFIVFDFRADGISPLQFISNTFCNEFFRQLEAFGMKKLKIAHMYESLISTGVVQFFYGFYSLDINLIQTLSALTYEGHYIDCLLYFPKYDSQGERRTKKKGLDVAFSEQILFSNDNLRQIRKMVEMSDKHLALSISETGKIRGMTLSGPYPNECMVRIWGHLSWTITYEDGEKISYYNARYHLHAKNTEQWHISQSPEILPWDLDDGQREKLETIIRSATNQRHGTILIISDPETNEKESERLVEARSATGIGEIDLHENPELIGALTSIDGALLMDYNCVCQCIGAILDGDAVTKGSPARGARYNSTVNYIRRRAQLDETYIGIVVSEDGMIDAVTKDRVYRLNLRN